MHLRLKYTVENSYSFQIGDAVRESVLKPWKIPLLPINLIRRHRKIQRNKIISNPESEFLFVIDVGKFTMGEVEQFQTFLSSISNSVIFYIGEKNIDGATHNFPSPNSTDKSPQVWNRDLEHLLETIVVSSKPEKFVFIGPYPYAGIMSLLRKVEPIKNTAWISLRAKKTTVDERSQRFGCLLEWPEMSSKPLPWRKNHLFISKEIKGKVLKSIKKYMNMFDLEIGNESSSRVHLRSQREESVSPDFLTFGGLSITIYDNEHMMKEIISSPSNQIQLFSDNFTLFEHQLKPLLHDISEQKFPGANTTYVEEEAWVKLYSSF